MKWEKLLNPKRRRPTTSTNDHREEFERDFDRAVFSTPVKRLQAKAQEFPLERHDAIRTRLTHSLEVSSVARGLGKVVAQWLINEGEIQAGEDRQIEAIAATCGLIHDLGNPPFGHSGEDAIGNWFSDKFEHEKLPQQFEDNPQLVDDFVRFEGNAQTLRLLTKLQILADYNGLNLTYGTLSALCKYIAPSHETNKSGPHERSKPGFFASENELIKIIRDEAGTGDARNPLTYLVEAADDIVFSVADVEDAVKKEIFAWKWLEEELCQENDPLIEKILVTKEKILKAGRDKIPDRLPDDTHVAAFRTAAIGKMVVSAFETFKKNYTSIMNGNYHGELVSDGSATPLVKLLKKIGRERVYCTPATLKLEIMGRKIICDLLDTFYEGVKSLPLDEPPVPKDFPGKIGALLSVNYRQVFCHFVRENTDLPEYYHRLQLLTDYICGMTDTFAKRLHAELSNAN